MSNREISINSDSESEKGSDSGSVSVVDGSAEEYAE